jgi:hypothetical protein
MVEFKKIKPKVVKPGERIEFTKDSMLQASEDERLKMLNYCCMPSNALMPATDDALAATANTLLMLALTKRIEQLEGELTKNGMDIPEWKDLLKNG